MIIIAVIAAVLATAILMPEQAFAWGPGTHLYIGKSLLDAVASNGYPMARTIAAYPMDFLYGSIFADLHFGKKFLFFARLAHNWRIGFKLLDQAETEPNRACAYGYLVHLAADTVAHNDYVPTKMVEQYHRKGKGHLWFEVAFDALLPQDHGVETGEIVRAGSANNDVFLESALNRTLLSVSTNRKLYKGLLSFSGNDSVRTFRQWRANNQTSLTHMEVEKYLVRCNIAVMDFVDRDRACSCYGVDPHGKAIIKQAWKLRRSLRNKRRQKTLSPAEVKKAIENIRTNTIEKV